MQLSRMGMGAGLGELVEGGGEKVGGEDGESSEEYDSDADTTVAVSKSPTAVDFADIMELAEEGEGGSGKRGNGAGTGQEDKQDGQGREEALFQRGVAFAQAQLAGRLVCSGGKQPRRG